MGDACSAAQKKIGCGKYITFCAALQEKSPNLTERTLRLSGGCRKDGRRKNAVGFALRRGISPPLAGNLPFRIARIAFRLQFVIILHPPVNFKRTQCDHFVISARRTQKTEPQKSGTPPSIPQALPWRQRKRKRTEGLRALGTNEEGFRTGQCGTAGVIPPVPQRNPRCSFPLWCSDL